MARKSIFKRIWETICKWLHFGCYKADNAIPIEDRLKMKKQELLEKKHSLENGDALMKVRGLKIQTDNELTKALKDRRNNNYDVKIKRFMETNNKEEARKLLVNKKAEDANIERLKEKAKQCVEQDKKITESLNILDEQIGALTLQLDELKERNRDAEQRNEMFALMNELNDITVNEDIEGISDLIRDNELVAHGREQEFARRNSSAQANREVSMRILDEELENYR